jgi:hypothetical protein
MENVEIVENQVSGVITVKLSGQLVIAFLEGIVGALQGRLEKFRVIELEYGAVTDMDLAFVQYYVSLTRYLEARQKRVVRRGTLPETLVELLSNTGLGEVV